MKSHSKRVLAWIRQNGLISPGDRVVCALSGGADSVAMTLLLFSLQKELGAEISAAHVNHMLRGAEADRDEAFCKSLCENLGIPFTALHGDAAELARKEGKSLEDGARELRYSLLASLGADRIAVAHNTEDNLETVIMRLARGGGARGLSGIPPKNGRVIRPVMCLSRAETEEICRNAGAGFVTDSSNLSDDYTRNLIRHKIMPVMAELNPAAAALALENSAFLRQEDAFLDSRARELLESAGQMNTRLFTTAGEVLSRRILRIEAEKAGAELDGRTAQRLYDLTLSGKSRFYADVPGKRFYGEYGRFWFGDRCDSAGFSFDLIPGVPVDTGAWTVELLPRKEENIYRKFNIFTLSSDKIQNGLKIRSVRDGDRFCRNGKSGTKTLKKLFSDMKLPKSERETLPVCAEGEGVLFVPGLGENFSRRPFTGNGEIFDIVFTKKEQTNKT